MILVTMGRIREHIKRNAFDYLLGIATLAILTYAALDSDYLAKKYYLDLNRDRIQDKVEVPRLTGIFGAKKIYLGQKDATGNITYKDLDSVNSEDLKMEMAEIEHRQKEQREAIEEVFRQYPK